MKKFIVNLFCIALVFSMTGLLYSCSDDDEKNVIDNEIDDPEYEIMDLPTEDEAEYQTYHYGTTTDEAGNTTPVEEYGESVSEGREEQPLTPYLAGLIADPLAHWMTENNIPDEWRESRKKQIIANSRGTMDDIIHAQSVTTTWTHGVEEWWKDKCSDEIWETLKDRQTVFTTTTRIYVAYSYDEDIDCYLFEQTVWANNSHKWLGSWSTGSYDHQGLYLYSLNVENKFFVSHYMREEYLSNDDLLILEDFSPETVVGSQTYSSSTGFNIGGTA